MYLKPPDYSQIGRWQLEEQVVYVLWLATQQPAFIKKPVAVPAIMNNSDTMMQADTTKKLAIN